MSNSAVFSLEIQELCRPENAYRIDVKCFTSIKDIKDQLYKELKYPQSRMKLYHSIGSKCLGNRTTLHDLNITQDGGVLLLALLFSSNPRFMLLPAKDMLIDKKCSDIIHQVRLGLLSNHQPAKTDMLDCTGGVYFMKGGANTPAAVFKPSDEEQGMPNNPKGYAGNGDCGLRPFFKPGEGYLRETASYILDYQNFCSVPPTAMVHLEHDAFQYPRDQKGQKNMFPKLGSLQQFVPSGDTFEDIGHSMVGVLELQKIALLDMRLLNCDRNASNMLAIRKPASRGSSNRKVSDIPRKYSRSSSLGTASEGGSSYGDTEIDMDVFLDSAPAPYSSRYSDLYSLVPIDHGYCLPSHLRIDELDWAWFHCPHVAVEVQPEIRAYVNSLDIDALLEDLTRQVQISPDCLFLLRVAHAVIKEGIAAGLTLRDIAAIIARTEEDVPSPLENAIAAAEDNAQRTIEARAGRRNTTSPSFLKSMQEGAVATSAAAGVAVGGVNITELLLSPSGYTSTLRSGKVPSPTGGIVKQRSVGSPRNSGVQSPPQRVGAVKRISPCSPRTQEEEDGYSVGSGVAAAARGMRVGRAGNSADNEQEEDAGTAAGMSTPLSRASITAVGPSSVVRPFPLRTTPPERKHRVVSSELNLEALGSSSLSLSSSSRSPLPKQSSRLQTDSAGKVSIGYLSSENIQKLQKSPAISAAKFPDMLFRDSLRTQSAYVPAPSAESARAANSPQCGDLGDYFMKDLSLLPPSAGASEQQFRGDMPPMPLYSSSSGQSSPLCSRGSSAFTLLHQVSMASSSKENLPGQDDKIRATPCEVPEAIGSLGANSPCVSRPSGSCHSLAASSSSGSANNLAGQPLSHSARPRPGDALFTLQSFDAEYLRQRPRAVPDRPVAPSSSGVAAALSLAHPEPRLSALSPDLTNSRPSRGIDAEPKTATHSSMVASSLFASDSDFTSHSTGTSYESSWASESPKVSPKLRKMAQPSAFAHIEVEGPMRGGAIQRVTVPVRDDPRFSNSKGEGAAGLLDDGPVHLMVALKGADHEDEPDRSSSAELFTTDTEGEVDEPSSEKKEHQLQQQQRTQNDAVRSLSKQRTGSKKGALKNSTGERAAPDSSCSLSALAAPKLTRVSSFAAFESPPLYELPKPQRQMTRMRQERRKLIATTAEFQELRLAFCKEMLTAMLSKTARNKSIAV